MNVHCQSKIEWVVKWFGPNHFWFLIAPERFTSAIGSEHRPSKSTSRKGIQRMWEEHDKNTKYKISSTNRESDKKRERIELFFKNKNSYFVSESVSCRSNGLSPPTNSRIAWNGVDNEPKCNVLFFHFTIRFRFFFQFLLRFFFAVDSNGKVYSEPLQSDAMVANI